MAAQYGSMADMEDPGLKPSKPRGAVNIPALLFNLFIPPLLFLVLFGIITFSIHYQYPIFVWWIWSLIAFVPLFLAFRLAWRYRHGGRNRWYLFSFFTLFVATALSAGLGSAIYWTSMYPFYFIGGLKTVSNVNPALRPGQGLMDAGKVYFADGVKLNYTTGMSFTSYDNYCVAPIVMEDSAPASYDFWAVGVNCCEPNNPEFRCGEFGNARARAGIRLMREEQRLFFRLAVQQAEAAYGLKADHPLFFYWVKDPDEQLMRYMADGYKYFVLALGLHGALNLFFVISFMIAFAPRQVSASRF